MDKDFEQTFLKKRKKNEIDRRDVSGQEAYTNMVIREM